MWSPILTPGRQPAPLRSLLRRLTSAVGQAWAVAVIWTVRADVKPADRTRRTSREDARPGARDHAVVWRSSTQITQTRGPDAHRTSRAPHITIGMIPGPTRRRTASATDRRPNAVDGRRRDAEATRSRSGQNRGPVEAGPRPVLGHRSSSAARRPDCGPWPASASRPPIDPPRSRRQSRGLPRHFITGRSSFSGLPCSGRQVGRSGVGGRRAENPSSLLTKRRGHPRGRVAGWR